MASKLDEEFSCPVCCDIYKDPVFLSCTHSLCKVCLQQYWDSKDSKDCPVCRKRCSKDLYPPNMVLKNLCDIYAQEKSQRLSAGSEDLCSLHGEKLKLFCEDDKQLVCLVCRDSKMHKSHSFSPTSEAALERMAELRETLKGFQERRSIFKSTKENWDETAEYIKTQTQNTEKQIKDNFEKLHQFLRDEEAARIAALREEEEQKSQMMKEKIEEMNSEISSLSDLISSMEKQLEDDAISFLQKYKNTMERAQGTLQDPEMLSGALINVAKHLGNLKFRVWEKMQEIFQYSPVILDPNTANHGLVLSEDLTSVGVSSQTQLLPDNPERFSTQACVLGSEGFDSGTHCWDVEVGDSSDWSLGVMTQSAQRKGDVFASSGVWAIGLSDGAYTAFCSPNDVTMLRAYEKPVRIRVDLNFQRIRVELNLQRRAVSFSDALNNTYLHDFKLPVAERVFPFFASPLWITPLTVSVTVKEPPISKQKYTI